MRRADSCPARPAPPAPALAPATHRAAENKELLRQQLLSASRERAGRQQPAKPRHARARQKNRWKLKFHHQALPQEYLDHYEQSLQKANAKQQTKPPEKPKAEPKVDDDKFTNETFKSWAQRLAAPRDDRAPAARHKHDDNKKSPAIAPSRIVTYEDLPYMGEMTLNNSKPRRGRKPKKADICHLIYENYGTVVPGQPASRQDICPPQRNTEQPTLVQKTDLQNKIICNLLERKLTQENRRRLESQSPPRLCSPDAPMPDAPRTAAGPLHSDDEPLNLCIRDLHDLKLQIQRKFGNIYSSLPEVKSEVDADVADLKAEQPNAISVIQRNTSVAPATPSSSPEPARRARTASPALSEPARASAGADGDDKLPGYVYWPHAGVYMHPLALHTQLLYYQRLAAAGQLPAPHADAEQALSGATSPTTPTSPDGTKKLVLKQISELLDPKVIKQAEEARSPDSTKIKRASPNPAQGPVKRKRSAIFIPPMPTKTSSTPTTEVSICKFKFTGGSKPSLQEKKMLSVDSGGNFRYYSGTGGKANKSCESIPREPALRSEASVESSTSVKVEDQVATSAGKEDMNKKKRKSRKTLQREKLEQTFKEKGFLIQTQQLQSAEGATYCKFRQLRKFTRYLFRSWKDYLPGELDDRSEEGRSAADWG
ncbi:uncharacterized protein [Battus philenor]